MEKESELLMTNMRKWYHKNSQIGYNAFQTQTSIHSLKVKIWMTKRFLVSVSKEQVELSKGTP